MSERFRKPTDDEYVNISLVVNEGHVDKFKLADMITMAEFIVDRLYDNGDVNIPSLREQQEPIMKNDGTVDKLNVIELLCGKIKILEEENNKLKSSL